MSLLERKLTMLRIKMKEDALLAKLPLGTSGFRGLRAAGQIYVDKTAMIYELASKLSSAKSIFSLVLVDLENLFLFPPLSHFLSMVYVTSKA